MGVGSKQPYLQATRVSESNFSWQITQTGWYRLSTSFYAHQIHLISKNRGVEGRFNHIGDLIPNLDAGNVAVGLVQSDGAVVTAEDCAHETDMFLEEGDTVMFTTLSGDPLPLAHFSWIGAQRPIHTLSNNTIS